MVLEQGHQRWGNKKIPIIWRKRERKENEKWWKACSAPTNFPFSVCLWLSRWLWCRGGLGCRRLPGRCQEIVSFQLNWVTTTTRSERVRAAEWCVGGVTKANFPSAYYQPIVHRPASLSLSAWCKIVFLSITCVQFFGPQLRYNSIIVSFVTWPLYAKEQMQVMWVDSCNSSSENILHFKVLSAETLSKHPFFVKT